jgi:excisionase family DNA binding protein
MLFTNEDHRLLNDLLHSAHLEAMKPSLEEMTDEVNHGLSVGDKRRISRSTIHNAFRSHRMPSWITVERILCVLYNRPYGTLDDYRDQARRLWQQANDSKPPERYYTVKEAAHMLGVSEAVVRRRIRTTELPSVRIRERSIRIPEEALRVYRQALQPH